jgi:16S rRNA (cytosine967-C5)-methyltransferase
MSSVCSVNHRMLDSAILNHAARVLGGISPERRADEALRHYLADARRLGAREKRAISRAVFIYFRWLQWLDGRASVQKQVEHAYALHERFTADPASVKVEALAALAVPAWLWTELDLPPATSGKEGGKNPAQAAYLRQLQREPVLWLRARPGLGGKLAAGLKDCDHSDRAPDALLYRGAQDLFLTPQFQEGAFEIQDLASQLVGHAAAPKPGETWWDACAGEGGKTLHLADLMQNKGLVWASDRSVRRLDTLKRRAGRAKLFNYRTAVWEGTAKLPTKGKFDGILLDAPCSGVGTWQRNPNARWTTTPADVAELASIQRGLLEQVCGSLKPGGRLVYAVCTLTRSETNALADAFGAAHPELEPVDLAGEGPRLTLWPQDINANGMFIAAWRKKKQ